MTKEQTCGNCRHDSCGLEDYPCNQCSSNYTGDEREKYESMYEELKPREECLRIACEIVNGARAGQYGQPEDNFQRIADYWGDYLDSYLTPEDVANMMILLKIARTTDGSGNPDNYVDIAGYAACAYEIMKGCENE